MAEINLTELRSRYIADLRAHDWGFEYADDFTAYQAGKASLQRLQAMRDQLPDGVQLWNAYAPVGKKLASPGRPS